MATTTVLVVAVCAAVGMGACGTTQVTSGAGSATAIAPAAPGVVPAGTTMTARLDQPLGTETSRVGDVFSATLDAPVVATDGSVVVPAGAVVSGRVTQLKPSKRVGDQASIALDFDSIRVGGESSPLDANVVDTKVKAKGGRTAKGAGIGAAAGAVLGGIIGGNLGGAVVGGLVGAGTGTLIGLGTGDVSPNLPAGTELSLRTTATTKIAFRAGGTT